MANRFTRSLGKLLTGRPVQAFREATGEADRAREQRRRAEERQEEIRAEVRREERRAARYSTAARRAEELSEPEPYGGILPRRYDRESDSWHGHDAPSLSEWRAMERMLDRGIANHMWYGKLQAELSVTLSEDATDPFDVAGIMSDPESPEYKYADAIYALIDQPGEPHVKFPVMMAALRDQTDSYSYYAREGDITAGHDRWYAHKRRNDGVPDSFFHYHARR